MAEALPNALRCSSCNQQVPLSRMKSLRCGHQVCGQCTSVEEHPACQLCSDSDSIHSRPESFAEVNLEMSLEFRQCEDQDQTDGCEYRGSTKRCHHCNLHLCPEHVRQHIEKVLDSGERDVRTLREYKRRAEQLMENREAPRADEQQFKAYQDLTDAALVSLSDDFKRLEEEIKRPIVTYENHQRRHRQLGEKALEEANKILDQMKTALEVRDHEGVLNAQRTLLYMQNSGAFRAIEADCPGSILTSICGCVDVAKITFANLFTPARLR